MLQSSQNHVDTVSYEPQDSELKPTGAKPIYLRVFDIMQSIVPLCFTIQLQHNFLTQSKNEVQRVLLRCRERCPSGALQFGDLNHSGFLTKSEALKRVISPDLTVVKPLNGRYHLKCLPYEWASREYLYI